jgi:regulator of protease activity HflC (stomatin/prohibitin superfamily)
MSQEDQATEGERNTDTNNTAQESGNKLQIPSSQLATDNSQTLAKKSKTLDDVIKEAKENLEPIGLRKEANDHLAQEEMDRVNHGVTGRGLTRNINYRNTLTDIGWNFGLFTIFEVPESVGFIEYKWGKVKQRQHKTRITNLEQKLEQIGEQIKTTSIQNNGFFSFIKDFYNPTVKSLEKKRKKIEKKKRKLERKLQDYQTGLHKNNSSGIKLRFHWWGLRKKFKFIYKNQTIKDIVPVHTYTKDNIPVRVDPYFTADIVNPALALTTENYKMKLIEMVNSRVTDYISDKNYDEVFGAVGLDDLVPKKPDPLAKKYKGQEGKKIYQQDLDDYRDFKDNLANWGLKVREIKYKDLEITNETIEKALAREAELKTEADGNAYKIKKEAEATKEAEHTIAEGEAEANKLIAESIEGFTDSQKAFVLNQQYMDKLTHLPGLLSAPSLHFGSSSSQNQYSSSNEFKDLKESIDKLNVLISAVYQQQQHQGQ